MLAEGGGDDAFRVDHGDVSLDSESGVGMGLDPADHGGDGGVVGCEGFVADMVVANGEQDRDGLRCVGGDVETSDGGLAVAAPEEHPVRSRASAGHQVEEVLVCDLAAEAEHVGAATVPATARLGRVEVVGGECLDVVRAGIGAFQRRHAGGHEHLTARCRHLAALPVHSSVALGIGGGEIVWEDMAGLRFGRAEIAGVGWWQLWRRGKRRRTSSG